MGLATNTATLLPGRSYEVDASGAIVGCSRKYQVLRAFNSPNTTVEVASVTGLPAVGAAHPENANLKVVGYRASEDPNGLRWVIEVVYAVRVPDWNWGNKPPAGSAEQSRGWESQDVNVDLVHDAATGDAVLNAAGDPFESVPQVPRALPVFRLVRKENSSVASRVALSGTVNTGDETIDGITIKAGCGRLIVGQRKLYGDPDGYASEFTYTVTVMSNIVVIEGTAVDIGWNMAFVEAGPYYLDEDGKPQRPQVVDDETKVAQPRGHIVLLNVDGTLNETGTAVNKQVATQRSASWGSLGL